MSILTYNLFIKIHSAALNKSSTFIGMYGV